MFYNHNYIRGGLLELDVCLAGEAAKDRRRGVAGALLVHFVYTGPGRYPKRVG